MNRIIPLLAVVAALASTSSSRADEIDAIFTGNRNAQELMQKLTDAKYQNVGILKGEVQTGGPEGPISLSFGKMGELLATRLENVLILATDAEKPIGITRGASEVAFKANSAATFATEAGRAALFQNEYPLAWGKKSVKVNAFLIPRYTLDAKAETVTLSLRYFDESDPKTLKTFPIKEPTTKLTPQQLIDLDKPFVMPASFFRKRGGDGDLRDEFPIFLEKIETPSSIKSTEAVKPGEGVKPKQLAPAPNPAIETSGVEKALEFKVFYDDKPAEQITSTRLKSPKSGQKVHFTMKSSEKLGVVVLVNGINTADYDSASKESNGYVKWVLSENQAYIVRGYYAKDRVYPFEVASKAKAKELLSGLANSDRFGLIELLIYKEVKDGTTAGTTGPVLRSETQQADTLEQAKENIALSLAVARSSVKKAFLVPGAGQSATLEDAKFDGVLAAKLQIRYAD
jgi:hypothetical protein